MSLDPAAIDHLARLARLALDPADRARLGADLGRTVAMMDALQQIDVDGVEPLAQPHPLPAGLRPDAVTETDASEALLALSGASHGGYYLVPRVIE
ncbi:MAG: Asp-tRNA(Asn)/Glu-tRNA(Gln) amidotransferase subunit GatC [Xanthomonadaceae bacterium]|jgi:aspartyl-tRNA(Asn)/glutamyl-tRNA(Gln) amidotransferase subunit C|nr:Asp-tRNA(Asn)/Glu-tRNA(Gln) amidotransferase subunit GatC [Xanthomonadaceae bacterium]